MHVGSHSQAAIAVDVVEDIEPDATLQKRVRTRRLENAEQAYPLIIGGPPVAACSPLGWSGTDSCSEREQRNQSLGNHLQKKLEVKVKTSAKVQMVTTKRFQS